MDNTTVATDLHQHKPKKHTLIIITGITLVIIGLGTGTWFYLHRNPSLVPRNIQKSVSFPVYYPDPKKLPAGYTLDVKSFSSPVKNGVTYTVNYAKGQKLVFSVQLKPSASNLQAFNANYIPLRNDYSTSVGQAEIGAYNNHGNIESLVSLPTNTNAWLIITGPYSINQSQLKQVLQAIKD